MPIGSFNDPVPVISTFPLLGASIKSPVLEIVESLKKGVENWKYKSLQLS